MKLIGKSAIPYRNLKILYAHIWKSKICPESHGTEDYLDLCKEIIGGGQDKMKKILLMAITLIFCFSGIARAESWILWKQMNHVSFIEGEKNDYGTWFIVGAFPTVQECWATEEQMCERFKELADKKTWPDTKCIKTWGGHLQYQKNKNGSFETEWKCLPDTVDPRK